MTVTGGLEPADDALLLTVSDEGPGFPETFPNPQGEGLGIRHTRTDWVLERSRRPLIAPCRLARNLVRVTGGQQLLDTNHRFLSLSLGSYFPLSEIAYRSRNPSGQGCPYRGAK